MKHFNGKFLKIHGKFRIDLREAGEKIESDGGKILKKLEKMSE